MWWNFVGRTHEDIAQARAAWADFAKTGAAPRQTVAVVIWPGILTPGSALPGYAPALRAWQRGRTGFPIVDDHNRPGAVGAGRLLLHRTQPRVTRLLAVGALAASAAARVPPVDAELEGVAAEYGAEGISP